MRILELAGGGEGCLHRVAQINAYYFARPQFAASCV